MLAYLSEPNAVQNVTVTAVSSTSVNVTWASSVAPSAMGNIITGYQVEAFIVDINMNTSNQTVSVGDMTAVELRMLSELEVCPIMFLYGYLSQCHHGTIMVETLPAPVVLSCDMTGVCMHCPSSSCHTDRSWCTIFCASPSE